MTSHASEEELLPWRQGIPFRNPGRGAEGRTHLPGHFGACASGLGREALSMRKTPPPRSATSDTAQLLEP